MSNSRGPGHDARSMTVKTTDGYQVPRNAADLVSPNDMSPEKRAEQLQVAGEFGLGVGFHVPSSWVDCKPSHVGIDTGKGDSVSISAAKTLKGLLTERGIDIQRAEFTGLGPFPDEHDWYELGTEDARDCIDYWKSMLPRLEFHKQPRPVFRKPRAPLATAPRLHTHAFSRSSRFTRAGKFASRVIRYEIPKRLRMLKRMTSDGIEWEGK